MKLWTIWQRCDGHTWLDGAWDDESTADNPSGWQEAVEQARRDARSNKGEMRIIALEVPDAAIFGAFEIPTVAARVPDDETKEQTR